MMDSNEPHDVLVVPAADRRNHFAREGLRRAVARRFATGELAISAGHAARLFELPLPMCERLLRELVSHGTLVRSSAGRYALRGRRVAPADVSAGPS